MNSIQLKAYAKINLGLDVLRKREDGYHEVKMIMQTVDIYDVLTFEKADSGIHVTVNKSELPVNEDNLIYKSAAAFMSKYNISEGVSIHLEKNIPIAAGMAGGSTDAAATFKALNQLFEVNASLEELQEIAVKIGADVPYCLMGGTALAEGIGEKLTKLPDTPNCHLVVAKPDIDVSTAFVYGNLKANELKEHPDIDGMVDAITEKQLEGVIQRLGNVLETVTVPAYPIIREIKETLKADGADGVLMSGSGPTVFAIFTDKEKAEKAFEGLKEGNLARQVFLTQFVS